MAAAVFVHPDYAGFVPDPRTGVVHDDLAIVRSSSPLPFGVPVHEIGRSLVPAHTVVMLVGYGASGDGVNGVTATGSSSVKRVGNNTLDAAFPDNGGGVLLYSYAPWIDSVVTSTIPASAAWLQAVR